MLRCRYHQKEKKKKTKRIDNGLLSKSAGFSLHVHFGRGALKIQGALKLLDGDAFVSNGTGW